MKIKLGLLFLFITVILCKEKGREKELLLLADREAPIGWIYLKIYTDSTFEFESRELIRKGKIYTGKASITNDTINFHYKDSVPNAGSKAAISKFRVSYLDGKYPETLNITLNKLKKDNY